MSLVISCSAVVLVIAGAVVLSRRVDRNIGDSTQGKIDDAINEQRTSAKNTSIVVPSNYLR